MGDDIVIKVDGLWKRYGYPPSNNIFHWIKRNGQSILSNHKSYQFNPIWNKNDGGIWALQDISFEIRRGEAFGVIGRNGSGKSTLLKILALTSPPTFGNVTVNGRIFSMIELTAGMHLELSGRENVRLLAAIMGLSPKWIAYKMAEIEEFSELGDWLDHPVWKYSSGMIARLGFSVAVNVEADILLIDEVLGVGDLAFQAKSLMRMDKLLKSNVTIVFVSHSLAQVRRLCNRTLLLDKGFFIAQGETEVVLDKYYSLGTDEVLEKRKAGNEGAVIESTGDVVIKDIVLIDESGNYTDKIRQYEKIKIRLYLQVLNNINNQHGVSITIKSVESVNIASITKDFGDLALSPGDYWIDFIPDFLPLSPGIYTFRVIFANQLFRIATVDNMKFFTVLSRESRHVLNPNGAFFEMTGNIQLSKADKE